MSGHTKGPWTHGPRSWQTGWHCFPIWADKARVGDAYCVDAGSSSATLPLVAEANARLMAAAPDLLDACKKALAVLAFGPAHMYGETAKAACENAITKAEGRDES